MVPIRSFSIDAREVEIDNPVAEGVPYTLERKARYEEFLRKRQAGYKQMYFRTDLWSVETPRDIDASKSGWTTSYISAEYPPEPEAKRRAVLDCLERIRDLVAQTIGGIDPERVGKE